MRGSAVSTPRSTAWWPAAATAGSTTSRSRTPRWSNPHAILISGETAHGVRHRVRGQAELLVDPLVGRRSAEAVDADRDSVLADPALPSERDAGLDRHARADTRWQHLVTVRLILLRKELPAGKRDDARVRLERARGLERERELGPGCEHDRVRLRRRVALPQDVAAAQRPVERRREAVAPEHRQLLAAQRERDG